MPIANVIAFGCGDGGGETVKSRFLKSCMYSNFFFSYFLLLYKKSCHLVLEIKSERPLRHVVNEINTQASNKKATRLNKSEYSGKQSETN